MLIKNYLLYLIMRLNIILTIILLSLASLLSAEEKLKIEKFQPPEPGFWETLSNLFIPHFEKRNIVLEKESEYFLITVEDSETGMRHLVFNPKKGSQSTINPERPDDVIPRFMQYSFITLSSIEKPPEKVLFIGLGAGIMPMFLRKLYPDTQMDIVEIDPAIEPIAKKYFGFDPDKKMQVITKDGRVFINNCKKQYDIIFIDAYNAKEIPFQLTTLEFFSHIKRCLNPDGLFVANIANFGDMNFIFSELETVRQLFANIAVFVCPGQTNFVFFASQKNTFDKEKMQIKSETLDKKYKWNFKLTPFLNTRLAEDYILTNTKDAQILTDEFAPVGIVSP